MLLFLTSLILATAHAVPMQTMHQGRLLDGDGVAMEGEVEVTFRLIDAETGGTIVWEETSTLTLTSGFYVSVLGADEEEVDAGVLRPEGVASRLALGRRCGVVGVQRVPAAVRPGQLGG